VAEALAAHEKARAIYRKLADANPTIPEYQGYLATSCNELGRLYARQKRFPEAFAALEASVALRRKLADALPPIAGSTNSLAYSYACRGLAHVGAGHLAEAAVDLRQSLELWARDKTPDPPTRFERARALALLAGLGGDAGSGVSAAEADRFAGQAVAALRDAVGAGWTEREELGEPAFDPLRNREDFRRLVKELEAKPAAAGHTGPDLQSPKGKK
jgi:tetratricopeptide (TPR) repeat protein